MTQKDCEICDSPGKYSEKINSLEKWRDEDVKPAIAKLFEGMADLRYFKAKLIGISIATQFFGAILMTLILHFVGR